MVGPWSRPFAAALVATIVAVSSLGLAGAFSGKALAELAGIQSAGASTVSVPSPLAHASAPGPTAAPSSSSSGQDRALALENLLRSKGVNPTTIRYPDFDAMTSDRDRQVTPTYSEAPAPMGVSDIGLENRSGVLVPYVLNTTSVAGTVSITNLRSLYVDGDGPDTYGIQLNSVANGVTVFGNSTYEYWAQNYIGYTVSTEQLEFGDEVWNFSSPSGYFPQSSVYSFSPNGTFEDFPYLYQGFGPTITIGYPFALTLYLNTSVIADRPALYFNYTVSNATFRQSDSYDYLIFNSTVGTPVAPAPEPYYQANGTGYDPIGLPNDMEIDVLGNDDGDTTAFLTADATISLDYLNSTTDRMTDVPSAVNAGSETGETSVGMTVYSSGGAHPVGIARSGPGFVTGLWNYSTSTGAIPVTVHLSPANAFLFVNPGTANNVTTAQWVPTSPSGTTVFYVPPTGRDSLDFLMSNYDPTSRVVRAVGAPSLDVSLAPDAAQGIYTPLFALNNSELAAISSSGSGTQANPYVLVNDQYGPLAPEFAQWDDFQFPVFPGLLLTNTTDWVNVTPPSFEINIPSWEFGPPYIPIVLSGLPSSNDLQIQFWNSSNISLVSGASISGWLASSLYEFPESSVMVWGCHNVLIRSNSFADQGDALLLYGGFNNTVWGNTFVPAAIPGADLSSIDDSGSRTTGINETESADLIYNNYFAVPVPATTPIYDPFPCDQYGVCIPLEYTDVWNVSEEPAADYQYVNGFNLTGSIIGTSYQGGNYWSNYGTSSNPFGVLPYNDSGLITYEGDYVPLVPDQSVTVLETGWAGPGTWTASIVGSGTDNVPLTSSSATTTAGFSVPVGSYTVAASATDYSVAPTQRTVDVGIGGASASFSFTPYPAVLDLQVTPAAASVLVNGQSVSLSAGGAASVDLTAGVESIEATDSGYYAYFNNVTLSSGSTTHVTIVLNPVTPPVGPDGTLALSVTPASASVWVDGSPVTLTGGSSSSSLPPGVHSVEATASGYFPYFDNVTVSSGSTTNLAIVLNPVTPPPGPDGTLSLSVTPASASVWVDGSSAPLTSGSYSSSLAPGVHSVEVTASGYLPYFNNVTVVSGKSTAVTIALQSQSTTTSSSGISTNAWYAIGGLIALAVILLIGLVYIARRSRKGAGPTGAAPAQPWQESAGTPPKNPPSSGS